MKSLIVSNEILFKFVFPLPKEVWMNRG